MRFFNWAVLKGHREERKHERRCAFWPSEREKGSRARVPISQRVDFTLAWEQKTNKETRKAGGGPKPTSASPLTFRSFLIKDVDRQRQQLRGVDEQLAGNENLIEEPIWTAWQWFN